MTPYPSSSLSRFPQPPNFDSSTCAASHTRARVTDVYLTTWHGRRVYEVDLDGRRGDYGVIVDARSGRILSSKFDPDD
ncbi:Uncharacterised protein [Helicobacter pametensis]|nr:Uncharacterised protein [Helicobacter pametensis]